MRIFSSPGHFFRCSLIFVVSVALVSCGGGAIVSPPNQAPRAGNVFVVGTDAPLAAVLSFRVTFTGLTLSDGTTTASLLASPQEVEFFDVLPGMATRGKQKMTFTFRSRSTQRADKVHSIAHHHPLDSLPRRGRHSERSEESRRTGTKCARSRDASLRSA